MRMQDATIIEGRFQVFAVKISEKSKKGRRGLKGDPFYFFYQGYHISQDENTITLDLKRYDYDRIFNDYLVEQSRKISKEKTVPHISISAIVGKNGSGKSTIVEFVLRLINNFAAIMFGEQLISDSGNEHLHYINGIEGNLYFFIDNSPYRMSIEGRKMTFDRYELDEDDDNEEYNIYKIVSDYHLKPVEVSKSPIIGGLGEFSQMRPYIERFFYTVVSNYSIYAYNTLDYQDESNTVDYEMSVRLDSAEEKENGRVNVFRETKNVDKHIDSSDCNWLHGIFHKNDGYKTPLVLTPYRDKGNIDINIENTLSRERFISMLLMSFDENGGFKQINGHLNVENFKIRLKGDYGREYINEHLDITEMDDLMYFALKNMVLDAWSIKLLGELDDLGEHAKGRKYGEMALDYIFYKTIKIVTKYDDYKYLEEPLEDFLNHRAEQEDLVGIVDAYIDTLKDDRSHITRKIRQSIAYLLTDPKHDVYQGKYDLINVEDVSRKAKDALKKIKEQYGYDSYVRDIEDMIPPAFLDTQIILKETDGGSTDIAFETLSSGEKQQIFSVCGLLYHLLNINSVKEDMAHKRFSYNNVNLILEEIELYFHPDFQKRYITMILDGISQLNLNNIHGINLSFVTHSPFILSDIPKDNLLIMDNGNSRREEYLKTFGANIYDMLKNSFFLQGTPIGSYAQWVITRIIIALSVLKYIYYFDTEPTYENLMANVKSRELDERNYEFLKSYFEGRERMDTMCFMQDYSSPTLMKRIKTIDEMFVREHLMKEYYSVFREELDRQMQIAELEHQLNILKNVKI